MTTGIDGGDGCGLLFNAVVGTGGDADQGAFIDFPATDGMPLPLNTHSAISAVINRGADPANKTAYYWSYLSGQ